MFLCNFCNKVFSNKANLCKHQKKYPECLKAKRYDDSFIVYYSCDFCEKEFRREFNKNKHMQTCPHKVNILEKRIKEMKEELDELKRVVNSHIISRNSTINSGDNSTTNSGDNSTINSGNNIIVNINLPPQTEPITKEFIQSKLTNLNLYHILGKGSGFGRFALDNIVNNGRMKCTNSVHKNCEYMTERGLVKDKGLQNFGHMFFSSVKDDSIQKITQYIKDTESDIISKNLSVASNIMEKIKFNAMGIFDDDIFPKFSTMICNNLSITTTSM